MPEIRKGKSPRGRKIVVYGGPGLGKSTFAASAPCPIFLPTEDGLVDIEVDHYPVSKDLVEFEANLSHLAQNLGDYRTIVVDSADWLEALIHAKLCKDDNVTDITAFGKGYGRGYKAALAVWEGILRKLQWFCDKGCTVIVVAHDKVVTISDPQHGEYSQATLRLHEASRDRLIEWADDALFLTPKIVVDKENERASGGGVRVFKTTYNPAYRAKHRGSLPAEIVVPAPPASAWDAYAKHHNKETKNG